MSNISTSLSTWVFSSWLETLRLNLLSSAYTVRYENINLLRHSVDTFAVAASAVLAGSNQLVLSSFYRNMISAVPFFAGDHLEIQFMWFSKWNHTTVLYLLAKCVPIINVGSILYCTLSVLEVFFIWNLSLGSQSWPGIQPCNKYLSCMWVAFWHSVLLLILYLKQKRDHH